MESLDFNAFYFLFVVWNVKECLQNGVVIVEVA